MNSTYFGLLAEFGAAEIKLEDCCQKYFGLNRHEANRAAAMRKLPVVAYRLGSRKSPWLISASDLAAYINAKKCEAEKEQRSVV